MLPAIRNWTRDEMMNRVAFFRSLKGSKTGLPDSELAECERELINVVGFHPPSPRSDCRLAGGIGGCSTLGDSDFRGLQCRVRQMQARPRSANAQSPPNRDVYADHRPVALRLE